METQIENFDLSISPQEDFNLFVNGTWLKKNKIPSKYNRWGTFEVLHEENLQKIKTLVESSNGYYKKLRILYSAAINEDKLNLEKEEPIKKYIQMIESCINKEELWICLSQLYVKGLVSIFGFFPEEDAKNSELVVPYIGTGGLGLPDRDYYFDEDKKEIRKKYKKYLADLFRLYYKNNNSYHDIVKQIYKLEEHLAEKTYTAVEKRDPEKNYHKMTLYDLNYNYKLNWNEYFDVLTKNKNIKYVIVDNPGFYGRLKELWDSLSLNTWKNYFKIKLLRSASSYLSDDYINLKFDFYNKTLSGQQELKPRWERAISMVNADLGELVGRLYVDKHFTSEAKIKMMDMVARLNKELQKRIMNLSWMSEETKKKAMLKNNAFTAKIGYPDKWRDFNGLLLEGNDSLLDISVKCSEFNHFFEMDRIFKPSDPNRWEMDPHTINAYFHPLKNEIVFPAGILQAPFFDVNAEDAFNYGAIGTVIGHEMTHSYDDMGSKFDYKGNLNNWWTKDDLQKFTEKAQYYIDQFSSFKSNGKNLNGELTLGENLADHGGVKIGFYALMDKLGKTYNPISLFGSNYISLKTYDPISLDGGSNYISLNSLSPEQKFFISWANIWKNNITPEELDKRIMTDPHSPGEWRINGTLANIPEFHEVFSIQSGDSMYRYEPIQMW